MTSSNALRCGRLLLGAAIFATDPGERAADAAPPSAERAYTAVASRVSGEAAMDVVRFMDQDWRLAGNPGFNASIDHIRQQLAQAGVESLVDEFPDATWVGLSGRDGVVRGYRRGSFVPRARPGVAVHQLVLDAAGGVEAPLDRRRQRRERGGYEGKVVKGAIVLGSADAGRLWQQAVRRAAPSGSSHVHRTYIRPAIPRRRRHQQDVLQWGGVPVRRDRESIRFQGELARGCRMRQRLRRARTRLKVDVRVHVLRRSARDR